MYIHNNMKSFDLGNPAVAEFIEELNYPSFYDKVKDKIPTYLRLEHKWADTLLHYYIGEWLLFAVFLSKMPWFDNEDYIPLQVLLVVLGLLFVAIPWLRKSSWQSIELTTTQFHVFYHTFEWKKIDRINKIRTARKHRKFGIQIVLEDETRVNVDLSLHKPHIGSEQEMFEYIYVFWKRGNTSRQT